MIVQNVSSIDATVIMTQREIIALREATSQLVDNDATMAGIGHALYGCFEAMLLASHIAGADRPCDNATVDDALREAEEHERKQIEAYERTIVRLDRAPKPEPELTAGQLEMMKRAVKDGVSAALATSNEYIEMVVAKELVKRGVAVKLEPNEREV